MTAEIEHVDTVIVGGGQAGLAMSEHLGAGGIDHVVLERHRIAERWRSERWDSLVANGPAWHDRFPTLEFSGDPESFPTKHEVVEYFETYAAMISAPIRTGVEVTRVGRHAGRPGFAVETSEGTIEAMNVVAATGPFQRPLIPALVPETAAVTQIHSSGYQNPDALPPGAVMVVGAGSSGAQIADELARSGKRVYLSVGPHGRPPRRYRGLDYVWWLGVLGKWDAPAVEPGMEHVTISVTGSHGGETMDFRHLAARGVTLVGRTETYVDGVLTFASDLADNLAGGDANYLSVLDQADAYVTRNGLDLPEEPEARTQLTPHAAATDAPTLELDLAAEDVRSIIWATGYQYNFDWLNVDVLDESGAPVHHRGVATEPGFYFVGLPWLTRRGSSFIYGVWHDARFLANHIAERQGYESYLQASATPHQPHEGD